MFHTPVLQEMQFEALGKQKIKQNFCDSDHLRQDGNISPELGGVRLRSAKQDCVSELQY